jgi:integrase
LSRLALVPSHGAAPRGSWEEILRGAVRDDFRVECYRPTREDPVLFGETCGVPGCEAPSVCWPRGRDLAGLCSGHNDRWHREGDPELDSWLDAVPAPLMSRLNVEPCEVESCTRSARRRGFCMSHGSRWDYRGCPDRREYALNADAVANGTEACAVPGCSFSRQPQTDRGEIPRLFCDGHQLRFEQSLREDRSLAVADFIEQLQASHQRPLPVFDFTGLPSGLALELQFAVQCRHDDASTRLSVRIFNRARSWLSEEGVVSILDRDQAYWRDAGKERYGRRSTEEISLVRYAHRKLDNLAQRNRAEVWDRDIWPVDELPVDPRHAHQRISSLNFTAVSPQWLRALTKRWAAWRLKTGTSPATIEGYLRGLRRFSAFVECIDYDLSTPRQLTRELLEDYRADVLDSELGAATRRRMTGTLASFLDDVRRHDGWARGLPANATYFDGERGSEGETQPRAIDEFVMAQIEDPGNIARISDRTFRTALRIILETGLRKTDALRLPPSCLVTGSDGAPYLRYFNHKLQREASVPISVELRDEIRAQQEWIAQRYRGKARFLLPATHRNPNGEREFAGATLNALINQWMTACGMRDSNGNLARVTPHQFRHTLGTRMINNDVPMEAVRRMLDHESFDMTARYARMSYETIRRAWEAHRERVNIRGERVDLDVTGELAEAALIKDSIARAKQTLPNGYCGLPLQQTCPHPNACLSCASFQTDATFLDLHKAHLSRIDELIAQAEASGQARVVEINQSDRLSLVRIIEGIEDLPNEEPVDAAA